MEYIENLINYIKKNLANIEVPDHKLHQYCNVSESKLRKDFKNHTGMTLRHYLIEQLCEYVEKIMLKNRGISYLEVTYKLNNYNFSHRTLLNQFKNYQERKNHKKEYTYGANPNIILQDFSTFSEILIRLILFYELAKPQIKTTECFIKHDVANTAFQFNGILPIETSHLYEISIDISDWSLSFFHIGIKRRLDKKHLYVPNTLDVYLSYLYTLDKLLEKDVNFKLMDSIKHWKDYVESTTYVSFLMAHYEIKTKTDKKNNFEIDRNSLFIKSTDFLIEDIRLKLCSKAKRRLSELYGVPYATIKEYIIAVKKFDFNHMHRILDITDIYSKKDTLDLFFEITQYPYLDNLLIEDPEFICGNNIADLLKLKGYSKEKIINCLIEFRKLLQKMPDDESCEFDVIDWLMGL
ncbi:MAG: hypothetical protein LBV72_08620 [Tannerella sp.]|jgi:AraC-like DNA-binding protein|nr:hypothetical protein [Tannerella sp.]